MTKIKRNAPVSIFARMLLIGLLVTGVSTLYHTRPACAQSADEAEAEQEAADAQKAAEARRAAKAAAPPSALPGAETEEQDAGHANRDLNPTDALYDAVNRGSLNAAKEALSRGANIYARNILDQTPLDMAIDLNRKDIIFLLLSMRGSDTTGQIANFDDAGGPSAAMARDTANVKNRAEKRSPLPKQRFDVTGGHPNPEVGFLGFRNR